MRGEKTYYTSYEAMPLRKRFWLHSESCYTEAELHLRQWILKIRANSGIHPDYLANSNSWFSQNEEDAFVDMYPNSWFYSSTLRPRHIIVQDDFLVQPIDSQRLQWPQLYELMQKTGDYLVLRNKNLPEEHLNQPMNYILLDLNQILKGLSQNTNIAQTKEQLLHLMRYIRAIEKHTSPIIGSDRLFLANFRSIIDEKIQPQLTNLIESQLLKEKLGELSKTINQVATERNRILHFAFSGTEINPHPLDFMLEAPKQLKKHPTQAAKACASTHTKVVAQAFPSLHFSGAQLRECSDFSLIMANEDVFEDYAQAISDLDNLAQFQNVIAQMIHLLGQAGEVYTISQFKEQLLLFLEQVDVFIERSAKNINELIDANTQAYHKAIHDEQNMSLLKKMLTAEKRQLSVFIKNQDILAQFPSTSTDLAKTKHELKQKVTEVIGHLSHSSIKKTNFAALAKQSYELNQVMDSMHQLIAIQSKVQGLAAPKAPEKLAILAEPEPYVKQELPLQFFVRSTCTPDSDLPCTLPAEPVCKSNDTRSLFDFSSIGIYLPSFLLLMSATLLMIFLVQKSLQKSAKTFSGTNEELAEVKVKLDDLMVQVHVAHQTEDAYEKDKYEYFIEEYQRIINKATHNDYEIQQLEELYAEINFFLKDYKQNKVGPLCYG
jgi:hypothetical protein